MPNKDLNFQLCLTKNTHIYKSTCSQGFHCLWKPLCLPWWWKQDFHSIYWEIVTLSSVKSINFNNTEIYLCIYLIPIQTKVISMGRKKRAVQNFLSNDFLILLDIAWSTSHLCVFEGLSWCNWVHGSDCAHDFERIEMRLMISATLIKSPPN